MVLHPAPSTDNASCTTTPWQKIFFCTLPPQFIMPPTPLPPGNFFSFLHYFSILNMNPQMWPHYLHTNFFTSKYLVHVVKKTFLNVFFLIISANFRNTVWYFKIFYWWVMLLQKTKWPKFLDTIFLKIKSIDIVQKSHWQLVYLAEL